MRISVKRGDKRRNAARKHRWLSLLIVALLVLSAPGAALAQSEESEHQERFDALARAGFGFDSCGYKTAPYRAYEFHESCAGEVRSWDGLELEGRIIFPKNAPPGPLPLVVMLHSWGANRQWIFGDPTLEPAVAEAGWSPARFLARGYVVLAYTARGFAASCGPFDAFADLNMDGGTGPDKEDPAGCVKGHTHLAERGYEVRDTQHLLGLLVDAGVADPDRLVVTGDSYGGGQTWLLATSRPWLTPAGAGPISLAAAVPTNGWTDLFDALAPNGRATDAVDQQRSTEVPFGVPKSSFFVELYRTGRALIAPIDYWNPDIALYGGRYNVTDPTELHSFMDGWAAVFSAGEPYSSPQAQDLPAALRGKSAFYDDDRYQVSEGYLAQVAARSIKPVPIFAVQGWTDTLFPAVQSLQMYRKLKAAHPGYPISMVLGDLGHGAQSPANQMSYWIDEAGRFVDAVLAGTEPERVVASFPISCEGSGSVPSRAGIWDALQGKTVSFDFSRPASTDSFTSDLGEEAAADPLVSGYLYRLDKETPVGEAFEAYHPACVTRDHEASASGATWRFPVDESGKEIGLSDSLTMLGLPRVSMDYTLEGEDASVIAKLWDVGTDGTKTLVTRGVYRLSPAAGDPQSGTISFQLFGNHWTFPAGHQLELEIGQRDAPFLRPNNLQSSLDISRVGLEVPTANG